MRSSEPEALLREARSGDRASTARLLSLVERGGADAREVGRLCHPLGGSAYTVGITGAPGSGKSTLTGALTAVFREAHARVGVLAVDPSSPYSGGAILGDRVRMGDHVLDEGVFIRSMATRGHVGGLTLTTLESVCVLDAVGADWILVETVGVGQVEVDIVGAADSTVVVVNPDWGDSVQANKAGLMEIADVFVINKADRPGEARTRRDLQSMLELTSTTMWCPPIVSTRADTGEGVHELATEIERHRKHLQTTGELDARRDQRLRKELAMVVTQRVQQRAEAMLDGTDRRRLEAAVVSRRMDPWTAADEVLAQLDT